MAAGRGDSERLKELLELKEEERRSMLVYTSEAATTTTTTALHPREVTTTEGDTLLHVVAACGDDEAFLQCARILVAKLPFLLQARNRVDDTPLHCAAAAGSAKMISCLLGLLLATDTPAESAVRVLRMENSRQETALHRAIRAADNKNKVACIDQLMAVDPQLTCFPLEEGTSSPLYLAISLGEVQIARHLFFKTQGKLSYSGPNGRNVLHVSVSHGQALPIVLGWLQRARVNAQLVSWLTIQKDSRDGSTPLHLRLLDGLGHHSFPDGFR